MTVIDVVSHTHWDREWYHSAVRFRQRLVALIDDLLDAPPSEGRSFLLDGQAVILEDYLVVRPERAGELSTALRRGSLEAGPWFVLPDELIPGGEALVRNLLAGRRTLRSLRATAPPILYCPDSFGHPATLGSIARGFGCELVIVWRGFRGSNTHASDSWWWITPSGERVLLYHLSPSGYELGSNLSSDVKTVGEQWSTIATELIPRSRLGVVLLLNGADHHARQSQLESALVALAQVAGPNEVRATSLASFAVDAAERAHGMADTLESFQGELRDSYGYAWTLPGTLATRAHQKRRNARLERTLLRDVEPWMALAGRARATAGGRSHRHLVDAAWNTLLLCHPHDTLCGCSTDEVARAMDVRLDEVEAQAQGLREDTLLDLIGHRQIEARVHRPAWRPVVVVRNPAARSRSGVATLRLTTFIADTPVGPREIRESSGDNDTVPTPESSRRRSHATPTLEGIDAVQVLARSVAHELTESPQHYPDDDLVAVTEVAAWIGEIRGYGVRCFEQRRGGRRSTVPNPAHADGLSIANGRIFLRVHPDGRVEFADLERDRRIDNLVRWESMVDGGDLYTPSPQGLRFVARFERARVIHHGPLRAAIEARWSFRTHATGGGRPRHSPEFLAVRLRFSVDTGAHWLRIEVDGENAATNHRLRLCLATDVSHSAVVADAAFGPVERRLPTVADSAMRMERPPRTAPLHRYVSLFGDDRGASVFSDGLAECEAETAGSVLITLIRSVGELSRSDLPERPGHAGWPVDTPEAQCRGAFAAMLAMMLHGARAPEVIDEIERTADDVLLPITGTTLRSALQMAKPVFGVELSGTGLAFSSAKESEDGEWLVLRCVNLLEQEQPGTWRLGLPITVAHMARLDETPLSAVTIEDRAVHFVAPARAVVTILVR